MLCEATSLDNMYAVSPPIKADEPECTRCIQPDTESSEETKTEKKKKRSRKKLYNDIKDFSYFLQIMSSIN